MKQASKWTAAGLGVALPILLLASTASAQDEKPSANVDKVKALQEEYDTEYREWLDSYRAAKPAERQELSRRRPLPRTWIPKFQKIIDEAPKDAGAADAAIWIVARGRATGPQLFNAIGVLQKYHSDHAGLATVCSAMSRQPAPTAVKFLKHLEAKSPHVAVRGKACFNLGFNFGYQAGLARTVKTADKARLTQMSTFMGREVVDVLKSADPEALEKEAVTWYEKVVSTEGYAALKHYRGDLATAAKSSLFELQNLSIGKVAPEIEGEDIDGNPIRLSDYRGKVVVLDFWGDW